MNHRKSLILFLLFTFAVNWLLALAFYISGLPYSGIYGVVFGMTYMLVPAGVSITLQKIYNKNQLKNMGIRFRPDRWFLAAIFLPPVAALASLGLSVLLPDVTFSQESEFFMERFRRSMTEEAFLAAQESAKAMPVSPVIMALIQGILAGVTVNAVFAFGEELGWRGYMHDHLIHTGFWKTSFFTGAVWGIWHAPMILMGHNYPDHPQSGVFMMTLWCIAMAPFFTFIRIRSGSVIAPALAHGTLNGTAGLSYMHLKGGTDLTNGITGIAGIAVFSLITLLIFLYLNQSGKEKSQSQFIQ